MDKYKSKQTPVPHPESPMMAKKPLDNLPKYDKIEEALEQALEEDTE